MANSSFRRARARQQRAALLASALPVLSACAFLLDFDALQKEGGTATGDGGSAGAAGSGPEAGDGPGGSGNVAGESAGDAGSAGTAVHAGGAAGQGGGGGDAGAVCEPICVELDANPCTVARCVDAGAGPECVEEPRTGLALEHEFRPIVAERHQQLGLVASANEFYLSVLSVDGGVSDAVIYPVGATGSAELVEGLRFGRSLASGVPLSLPALAVDESSALALHAYVAVKEAAGAGARVWHVVLDAKLEEVGRTVVGGDYLQSPTLEAQLHRPAALKIGDSVWGAWVQADGTIAVANGTSPRQFHLGSSAIPASNLTLLATRGNQPAVLYTSASDGVFLQSEAGGQAAVNQCQTALGAYQGIAAAPTSLAGLWLASWTKSGDGFLTTESKVVLCGANGACAADTGCDPNEGDNFARNVALATQHLPGDPSGVLYYLSVVPSVSDAARGASLASIGAHLSRIEFGTMPTLTRPPATARIGEPVLLSSQPTSAARQFRGPDLAAAALVGRTAAVGWVEPLPDGRDQLRVQRYALCLP